MCLLNFKTIDALKKVCKMILTLSISVNLEFKKKVIELIAIICNVESSPTIVVHHFKISCIVILLQLFVAVLTLSYFQFSVTLENLYCIFIFKFVFLIICITFPRFCFTL